MKVMVKKWGNSASVRIPAAVMAAAAVFLEQAVSRRTSVVRIIILTRPNVWRNLEKFPCARRPIASLATLANTSSGVAYPILNWVIRRT